MYAYTSNGVYYEKLRIQLCASVKKYTLGLMVLKAADRSRKWELIILEPAFAIRRASVTDRQDSLSWVASFKSRLVIAQLVVLWKDKTIPGGKQLIQVFETGL